jgi:hypothetical protein
MTHIVTEKRTVDFDEFATKFNAEVSSGKKFYTGMPMSYVDYINSSPMGSSPYNVQIHEETGVRLDLSIEDFEKLMACALEGHNHKRYREINPAAADLYNQYRMVVSLSQRYNGV